MKKPINKIIKQLEDARYILLVAADSDKLSKELKIQAAGEAKGIKLALSLLGACK